MSPHRILNTALATLAAALTLAALGPALDAAPDARGEHLAADQLASALQAEQQAARREAAARAICEGTHGVNAGHRWTDAGELVCTTKRGGQPLRVASATVAHLAPPARAEGVR